MLRGSCACGRIQYEISQPLLGPLTYCHCRKQSGSTFGTTAGALKDSFRIVKGENLVAHWNSSPAVRRYFASCCGSPIWKEDDEDPTEIGFRLGTLDDDPKMSDQMHFHTGSKAPWYQLTDSLPKESGGCPFGRREP